MNFDDDQGGLGGLGTVGAVAGAGLALGAVAFGAFLSHRHRDRGHSDAPDRTYRRASAGDMALVGRTVTIDKPAADLYAFWRDFRNLPQVMVNLESVEPLAGGDTRHRWTIKAPAGTDVAVETEVGHDEEGKLIAWRSVPSSEIETRGRVSFEEAPGDRGTRVTLEIAYDPPAGEIGRLIAKAFGREPNIQARHALKRFRMLMETGEIATSQRNSKEDAR